MKGKLGLILAVALFPALLFASSPVDALSDGLQNWTVPPYWSPREVSPEEADQGDRTAPAAASQASITNPVPLPFVALTPCRIIDTRVGLGLSSFWGPPSLVGFQAERMFPILGRCGIPPDARAVSFNFTAVNPVAAGGLRVFAASGVTPVVSTLNWPANILAITNAAVVSLGPTGFKTDGITVHVDSPGGLDLVVDINGYYSPLGVVNSLNGKAGALTLVPGTNVTITAGAPGAGTLTIAAAGGGGSGSPSGPAGGSLTGTYPNPGIAAGAVGATQLANQTAVRSINGAAQDLVTIQGGGGVSVSTAGSTITIGAPSGSMVLGAPGDTTLIGAGYTEIASTQIHYWTATTTAGAPQARGFHTAIWTGSRMIVWGGQNNSFVFLNDGGQYDPVANSWTATSTTGAPSPRGYHTATWTGSRMIVWGGFNGSVPNNEGGQFDPVGNSWTSTTTTGAPTFRFAHTAVWTGSRMIIWGGELGGSPLNTGGRYDPATNVWTATSTAGAPSARESHTAVWTGSKMIVWGGNTGVFGGLLSDGGQYEPISNTWTATTTTAAPSGRSGHTAVWAGSRMIVWGGSNNLLSLGNLKDGGQFDPVANAWTATSATSAPTIRGYQTAVWTGTVMVVWGGDGDGILLNDGGQYDPVANNWTPTLMSGAPSTRFYHTAVWTGSKMIVWGGVNGGRFLNDGGQLGTVSLYRKN